MSPVAVRAILGAQVAGHSTSFLGAAGEKVLEGVLVHQAHAAALGGDAVLDLLLLCLRGQRLQPHLQRDGAGCSPSGDEQQPAGALHAQSGAESHPPRIPQAWDRRSLTQEQQLQWKVESSPALQRPFPSCLCHPSHCSPCCPWGPVPRRWRTPCRCCSASRCTGLHSSPGCPPGRGHSTPESWLCSPETHIPPHSPGQSQTKTVNTWD